jgi:hypothetical protein
MKEQRPELKTLMQHIENLAAHVSWQTDTLSLTGNSLFLLDREVHYRADWILS